MLEFAGSNPCVVLYGRDGGVTSAASYWAADYTPLGAGEALFLLRSGCDSERSITAYSMRPELADYLWTFNQHFQGFEDTSGALRHAEAEFHLVNFSNRVHLSCSSSDELLGVSWGDLAEPLVGRNLVDDFGHEPGRSYYVTSTVIPAGSGAIAVNESLLPGHVIDTYGELPQSAFLAWSETWERVDPIDG